VLTWNNLRIMTASGLIDVESHTYDLHRRIPRGPNGEQAPVLPWPGGDETEAAKEEREDRIEADLVKSRQLIQTNLGTTSEILSWPFSASDPGGITAAQRAGFRYMVTGTGYCYPGTSMDQIARIAVPATMDLDSFIRFSHPARLNYFQAMGAELQVIQKHISALVS
jgi:poly-beta-1,6-N-acetyl-D-glucosamine N-deacetylase